MTTCWPGTPYPGYARPAVPGSPREVIRELIMLLRAHGLTTRMYAAACTLVAVVSITPGLTVWCQGASLRWRHQGQLATWPAGDTEGAAAALAALARSRTPVR